MKKKEVILNETKENIDFYNKETLKLLLNGKVNIKVSILSTTKTITGGGNNEEITMPYRIFYTGMEKIKKIFEVKHPPTKNESMFSMESYKAMKFPNILNSSNNETNETMPSSNNETTTPTQKIKITIFGEETPLKNDYKELLEEWKWINMALKMKLYIENYEKYKINNKIILLGEVKECNIDKNEETIKEQFKEKNKKYLDKYENTTLLKEISLIY
jgi:hypothetical protein